jgi:hypothetical protein
MDIFVCICIWYINLIRQLVFGVSIVHGRIVRDAEIV